MHHSHSIMKLWTAEGNISSTTKPDFKLRILNISENNFPRNLPFLCLLRHSELFAYSKREGKKGLSRLQSKYYVLPSPPHLSNPTHATLRALCASVPENSLWIYFLINLSIFCLNCKRHVRLKALHSEVYGCVSRSSREMLDTKAWPVSSTRSLRTQPLRPLLRSHNTVHYIHY